LAIGGIAANWGSRPPKSPHGDQGPCVISRYLGPHKCTCQMASHSVQWVHECDKQQTSMHTYWQVATAVTVGGITISDAAW